MRLCCGNSSGGKCHSQGGTLQPFPWCVLVLAEVPVGPRVQVLEYETGARVRPMERNLGSASLRSVVVPKGKELPAGASQAACLGALAVLWLCGAPAAVGAQLRHCICRRGCRAHLAMLLPQSSCGEPSSPPGCPCCGKAARWSLAGVAAGMDSPHPARGHHPGSSPGYAACLLL